MPGDLNLSMYHYRSACCKLLPSDYSRLQIGGLQRALLHLVFGTVVGPLSVVYCNFLEGNNLQHADRYPRLIVYYHRVELSDVIAPGARIYS